MLQLMSLLILVILLMAAQDFLSRTMNKFIGWILPICVGLGGLACSTYFTMLGVGMNKYVNIETLSDAMNTPDIVLLFLISSFICLIPAMLLTLIHINVAYKAMSNK